MANIVSWNSIGGLVAILVSHPVDTLENVGKMGQI